MKLAVELEQLDERKRLIKDMNCAFTGDKKHIQSLDTLSSKIMQEINKKHKKSSVQSSDISWDVPNNWESELKQYQR